MIGRLVGICVVCPVLLGAQAPVSAMYAVSPDVSMRIWVPEGTVRVEVWDRDSVRVTGSVVRGAHFFGGGSGQSAKFGVEWDDHNRTALPHGEFVVTVPRKAHVWVKMTNGTVTATGTAGEFEAITVSGSIAVQDAKGVVSVETIDATVTLARIAGEVRARGGSGPVILKQIDGTLTVATVSGSVDLTGSAMQDARIETIGGRVTVRGTVAHDALLDLETHSGTVSLYVDRGAVPSLALSSRGGVVKNPVGAGNATSGKIAARSFKGDVNVTAVTGIEGKKGSTPP